MADGDRGPTSLPGDSGSQAEAPTGVGLMLLDAQGNPMGRLHGVARWGPHRGKLILVDENNAFLREIGPGEYITAQGQYITLNNRGDVIASRSIPNFWETSSGGGGTSLADQLAYLREQMRLEGEEGEKTRAFQAQEAEKSRLAQFRLEAAGRIQSLLSDIFQGIEHGKELLAEYAGHDPLRAAGAAYGGLGRGTTPAQAFRGELTSFVNEPVPQMQIGPETSLDALAQQEQALRRRARLPETPTLGFAKGGIIEMTQGGDGSYSAGSQAFAPGTGIRVGEQGEEILENLGGGRIKIIPLAANAQYGFEGNMSEADYQGLTQAFAPIYDYLGMPTVARAQRSRRGDIVPMDLGGYSLQPGGEAAMMQRLGIQPRMIRNMETGRYYLRDPVTGALRSVPSYGGEGMLRDWGYDPASAFAMSTAGIRALGQPFGPALMQSGPPEIQPGISGTQYGPLGLMVNPTSGFIAPDPARLASFYRQADPALQGLIDQFYDLMENYSSEQARQRMAFFTPQGTAGAARAAAFG